MINGLKGYLQDKTIRPMTDLVNVSAPEEVPYTIGLTYYINRSDSAKAVTIQAAVAQAVADYQTWQRAGGMAGQVQIELPSVQITDCVRAAFTFSGLKSMGILLLIAGAFAAYFKFSDRFGGSGQDPPGALPSARRAPTAPPPGWGERAERRAGGTAPGQSRWNPFR